MSGEHPSPARRTVAGRLRSAKGALAALAVGGLLYGFFAATTSRIPGFGADGESYAAMAKSFDPTRLGHLPAVIAPHNTRYLPSVLAHYIDDDPVVAFRLLNVAAIAGFIVACYGILRFYDVPLAWALVALALTLTTWPALRFWIYYPVLTDQIGNALLAGTIWTILTKRYVLYTVLAAALLATRENGAILLIFFVVFHANPWNPDRDRVGHPVLRMARLAAWNLFPVLILLQVRLFPLFPQSNTWNLVQYSSFVVKVTLASVEKQHQMLLAVLNSFGLLVYLSCWGIASFGVRRALTVLRSNLHWVWYVSINVVLAPISWTDHERFLMLAVPVLALVSVHVMRAWPVGRVAKLLMVTAVIVGHGLLTNAFGPLADWRQYLEMWGSAMNAGTADRLMRTHVVLAMALAALLLLRLIASVVPAQPARSGPPGK